MKILAIIMIALGGFISFVNWMTLYQSWKTKKFVSSIPLFGAIFLGAGLACFQKTRNYAFLSLVADYGTLVFIISAPKLLSQFWQTSSSNLFQAFDGQSQSFKYKLNLYNNETFVIDAKAQYSQPANEYGARIEQFGLCGKWENNEGIIYLTKYDNNRVLKLIKTDDNKYIAEEINYPQDRKYKYDLMNGIMFSLSIAG
jgi:hypothetical protein